MLNEIDIELAAQLYQNAKPFPHIVIQNAIDENVLNAVHDEFPNIRETKSVVYANPLEIKNITSGRDMFGKTTNVLVDYLNSPTFLAILQKITGIERPLVADPKLMGGGLHESPKGGLLKVHTDFQFHYETGNDRRINLLLYLNKDWKEEYGGHIGLYSRDMKECMTKVLPTFNTMVIFNTDEYSYHGLPDPINCPDDMKRKSLALYYYTAGRPDHEKNPIPHNSVWHSRKDASGNVIEADKDVDRLNIKQD